MMIKQSIQTKMKMKQVKFTQSQNGMVNKSILSLRKLILIQNNNIVSSLVITTLPQISRTEELIQDRMRGILIQRQQYGIMQIEYGPKMQFTKPKFGTIINLLIINQNQFEIFLKDKVGNQMQQKERKLDKYIYQMLLLLLLFSNYFIREMGNDGGDIPGRKQLVKDKQKIQLPDPQAVAVGRARFCTLTKQRLRLPMAICRLGYIFNYDCLLEALLTKSLPVRFAYIRKASSIRQIYPQTTKEGTSDNVIICPISRLQYNGMNKFVALWTCGHVFALKAIKQIDNNKKCLTCQKPYLPEDIIDLSLDVAEIEKIREVLLQKSKKKEKKEDDGEIKDKIVKKVKKEVPLNKLQQLDGDISEVIRGRSNFKKLFHKQQKVQGDLMMRNTKIGIR